MKEYIKLSIRHFIRTYIIDTVMFAFFLIIAIILVSIALILWAIYIIIGVVVKIFTKIFKIFKKRKHNQNLINQIEEIGRDIYNMKKEKE